MVIFRFFKMAAAAILDFRNFKFLTVGTIKKVELHQCVPNFVKIARTAAEICKFQYSRRFWGVFVAHFP